ncbi:MAG TPA: tetratricopeptide repeat protein [Methylophilaceae bacterium]|jgi:tetratricopeptide (TPR) repeat protein
MHGIVPTDDLPERIVGYLKAASSAMGDWREAESLLLRALAVEPSCLHVYYTLYKLYFKNNRLSDADRTINLALDQASKQAGFAADWHLLTAQSCDWRVIDSPQHFYLFSLKALAFVRLRQACVMDANHILAKLREIDPHDSVGASVIEAYSVGAAA